MKPSEATHHLHSPADLEPIVREVLSWRKPRTIWLLEGEVGSGKTETVKTVARVLGLREVASPSFAIHHQYLTPAGWPVDHLDLYRLESADDLESTGFWDLFGEPEALILIEWADRLSFDYLPRGWTKWHWRFEKGVSPTERFLAINEI